MDTFQLDLVRFTGDGFGTLHGPGAGSLHAGGEVRAAHDAAVGAKLADGRWWMASSIG